MKRSITVWLLALLITAVLVVPVCGAGMDDPEAGEVQAVPVYVRIYEGWEPVSLWAWTGDGEEAFDNWPGEPMAPIGDGWYRCFMPTNVESILIYGCDGEYLTVKMDVEPGVPLWVDVEDGWTVEVSYEPQTADYVASFTVHVRVPDTWTSVCLWAYEQETGTNAYESQPGPELTASDSGWYTREVPGWVDALTLGTADGALRTEEVMVSAQEVWITVGEDLSVEVSDWEPVGRVVEPEGPDTGEILPSDGMTGADRETRKTFSVFLAIGMSLVGAGALIGAVIKQKKS